MTSLPLLSVVVPCFNEEEVLPETARRLESLLDQLASEQRIAADSHVVFVDDGSTDATWRLIKSIHERSSRIRGLKLSRNFGHQRALLAGLMNAQGDIVVSIDADLQDDIGTIGDMIAAHAGGADVVLGVRRGRISDTRFKRSTAEAYYRLLQWMGAEIVPNHADYRLLSRRALEALRTYDESNVFLRALVMQLGFKTAQVYYERRARAAGKTKYPLRRMVSFALGGITAFSNLPLRYITAAGFLISILSFALGVWAISALILGFTVPGWTSTVVPIYFLGGVQLVSLGIIGEYVGRIYQEAKRRPRYIIEEALTVPSRHTTSAPDMVLDRLRSTP